MDEAVQLIVVAVVALAAAMILIFMVRGQSGSFLDIANSQVSEAENTIEEERQEEGETASNCPEGEVANSQGECVPEGSTGVT